MSSIGNMRTLLFSEIRPCMELDDVFESLGISEEKKRQVLGKPQIEQNLRRIFGGRSECSRLLYTLACSASKRVDIDAVAKLVDEGVIKHESMLKECLRRAERTTEAELREFAEKNSVGREEILRCIAGLRESGVPKRGIMSRVKSAMPCADFRFVMEEINRMPDEETGREETGRGGEFDWLEEGEVKKLFRPGENPQISEEIRAAHLKRTGGRVVTRFPPEPNGYLHVGHAKAINLSFEYARKFGGYTYLRYDDTNPKNEAVEYFESILEDVRWLGFEPHRITASSDYFDKMTDFSFQLIRKGKAYVCHLSAEEISERRRRHSADPSAPLSPHRDRMVEENLRIFQEMLDGRWREGEACLRFRMDTETRNPLMFDLVGVRIVDVVHPMKNVKFPVYPTYEFALCVADSLEDVTHSFCSREFYTRQESYNWLIDQLEIYKPVQWEFSRLNVSNTILSKRKILPLVKHGILWDDPRLFTLKGMRRRGFPPAAINEFCRSVGLTFAESIVDVRILENFVRNNLNRTARRVMCVRDPLKVTVLNAGPGSVMIPDFPGSDAARPVPFTPVIYIERSDFMENGGGDFLRFTSSQPVGLYMLYAVRLVKMTEDGLVVERCEETPRKFIHWVSEDSVEIEMRMYSPLWTAFNPEESNYLEEMDKNSLEICMGRCDRRILGAEIEERLQFQRMGYFCVDKDTTQERIVVNLTIPLKNAV